MPQGACTQLSRGPKNKTPLGWRSTRRGSVIMQGKIRTDASFSRWVAWGLPSTGHRGPCQHCMFPCHGPDQHSPLCHAGDEGLPGPSKGVYSEPHHCPCTQPRLPLPSFPALQPRQP